MVNIFFKKKYDNSLSANKVLFTQEPGIYTVNQSVKSKIPQESMEIVMPQLLCNHLLYITIKF